MSLIGRLSFGLDQLLRRSQTTTLLRNIEATPHLPQSDIASDQLRRLSRLLEIAEAHVPYYRSMFKRLGMQSQDIQSLQDYALLPVLTKEIIRNEHQNLIREDLDKTKLLLSHSGGSTGEPLSFYHDLSYEYIAEAGTFRSMIQCGWTPGENVAYFWGGNERLYGMSPWWRQLRQKLRCRYQFDPFYSGPDDMDTWLTRWEQIKPQVAYGYASTIARFATHIQSRGHHVGKLRGVFTTAEKLYAPQREIISSVFGCHVYDCYGSSEIRNIATECSLGRMHVNSDFVILETEHNTFSPVDSRPFILTSLVNSAMPFLRYRNEDCGQLLSGHCNCGSNFPLMSLNIARTSDNLVLPGGRVVHGEFFTHLMYGSEGISIFQFQQTAPNVILLWIVPGPGNVGARNLAIRKTVDGIRNLHHDLQVEVRVVDSIPLSKLGKHRFVRSEVRLPS